MSDNIRLIFLVSLAFQFHRMTGVSHHSHTIRCQLFSDFPCFHSSFKTLPHVDMYKNMSRTVITIQKKLNANPMHYGASIAFGKIQQNAIRAHLISVTSGGAGVGVTKPISSVPLFPRFSPLSKHWLPIEYHVYIWQMSPQLSCGDTCQIWKGFLQSYWYFHKIEKFPLRIN